MEFPSAGFQPKSKEDRIIFGLVQWKLTKINLKHCFGISYNQISESTVVGLSTDPAPLIISIFFDLGFYGLKPCL